MSHFPGPEPGMNGAVWQSFSHSRALPSKCTVFAMITVVTLVYELGGWEDQSIAPCMVLFGYTQYSARQTCLGQYVDFTQHKDHCSKTQAWAMLSLRGSRISGMVELPSSITSMPPTLPSPHSLISSLVVPEVLFLSTALSVLYRPGCLSCSWHFVLKSHVFHSVASSFSCSVVCREQWV